MKLKHLLNGDNNALKLSESEHSLLEFVHVCNILKKIESPSFLTEGFDEIFKNKESSKNSMLSTDVFKQVERFTGDEVFKLVKSVKDSTFGHIIFWAVCGYRASSFGSSPTSSVNEKIARSNAKKALDAFDSADGEKFNDIMVQLADKPGFKKIYDTLANSIEWAAAVSPALRLNGLPEPGSTGAVQNGSSSVGGATTVGELEKELIAVLKKVRDAYGEEKMNGIKNFFSEAIKFLKQPQAS